LLLLNSFRLVADDPLEALKDLRKDLYTAVTFRNGCVYCHSLSGTGSQSHHITAMTGKAHGGRALPLESYPPEVWKAFIFDQNRIAEKIGASPNPVAEQSRELFFDFVNRLREARGQKN
jgi:hypothetical protein